MPGIKTIEPTDAHRAYVDDMKATLARHSHLTGQEMLGLTAYVVGQLIALQDSRCMTPAMAMTIVSHNIELGNASAIQSLFGETVGRA